MIAETEMIVEKQLDPSKILQVGMGFFASKTLLTAVKMGLFTLLSDGVLSGEEIRNKLDLHNRSLYDFLDALVALGFLNRTGLKDTALYSNSADTDLFLDKKKPSYVGGFLEMSNNRLYPFWNNLEEGLKSGTPQNEIKNGGKQFFDELYAKEERLREFLHAMGGIQMSNFMAFANKFDFSKYKTHCDVGGAGAYLSAQIAMLNKHMQCTSFDLPAVVPVALENIESMGLSDRVQVKGGDFFKEPLPQADVITMGNILHDWGMEDKMMLIKKAYDALPEGGAFVVIENIIDDNRSENTFGLLMSLNMLIETPEGFDFSGADFYDWTKEVGFKEIYIIPLTGPSSAAVAIK